MQRLNGMINFAQWQVRDSLSREREWRKGRTGNMESDRNVCRYLYLRFQVPSIPVAAKMVDLMDQDSLPTHTMPVQHRQEDFDSRSWVDSDEDPFTLTTNIATTFTIEYHIIHDKTYMCPVLYFQVWGAGGEGVEWNKL